MRSLVNLIVLTVISISLMGAGSRSRSGEGRANNRRAVLLTTAWAPTLGPENEFGVPAADRAGGSYGSRNLMVERRALDIFNEAVARKCRRLGCVTEPVQLEYFVPHTGMRITFPDGFSVVTTADPYCLEIKGVATLNQWRRKADVLQRLLFDTAHAQGLTVGGEGNGNQINIGVRSTFGDDGAYFMRFITEVSNRPELALGIFNHDLLNANPLAVLGQEQRDVFEQLVRDTGNEPRSIESIAHTIINRVYTHTGSYDVGESPSHYQAANVDKSIIGDRAQTDGARRVELRFFRAPNNMDEFITQMEFVQTWLEYVKNNPEAGSLYLKSNEAFMAPEILANRFQAMLNDLGFSLRKQNEFWNLVPEEIFYFKNTTFFKNGRIDLGTRLASGDYAEMVKVLEMADLILISPTAREQILRVLKDERAIRHQWTERFFDRLADLYRERSMKDPRVYQAMADFMSDVHVRAPQTSKAAVRAAALSATERMGVTPGQCRLIFRRTAS